jgi:hypothetical protein
MADDGDVNDAGTVGAQPISLGGGVRHVDRGFAHDAFTAEHDALAVDRAGYPLASRSLEVRSAGQRQAVLLGGSDDGGSQRMFTAALDTGCQT